MMRKPRKPLKPGFSGILFGLAILLLLPALASAQVQRGNLFVKVADEQGGILPGATLELTSPVMPGVVTAVTDSNGAYHFPSLVVGTYQLKVSLQGMQSIIRQGLIVQQDQTVELSLVLKVGSMAEAVTVQAETPVVDTKAATLQTNIDKNILQATPGGQDIWSIIEFKAPGVTIDTGSGSPPDVGGNQGGLQRSLTSRGVPNAQNTQMLNGVNVNDPAAQGFSMNYYVPQALDNIQVSTAADDISIGTAGVFINMVTKSGSNRYGGSFFGTCQGDCGVNTQSSNIAPAQQADGIRAGSNGTNILTNTNFQIGGPIIHNKLFFFDSTNFQAIHVGVTSFPAVAPLGIETPLSTTSQQDTTDTLAGEGKVNFQLNTKNRFEGYLSKQRYDKPNRGSAFSNTQDSDWHELDTFVIMQASWNYVMSDRMFLDTRVSYNNTHFDLNEKTDLQPLTDNATFNTYQNESSQPFMFRRRSEVLSNWQYFLPKWLGGRHEFRLGFDNGNTPETVTTSRAQNVNITINSLLTPEAQTVTLFNSPTIVNRAVNSTALYGQETYSLNRLTAVAGIRWERVEGYLPPQTTTADSEYFPSGTVFNSVTINGVTGPYTVQDQFAAVHNDPLWHNWAPRTSLTYDLTGKGKSAVKFSAGRYLDQINTGTPPNPNGTISQTYVWNDVNHNLQFDPDNLVFNGTQYIGPELGRLTRTSIPAPAGFNQAEQRPFTNEQTVEFDQELRPGLAATIAFVHTAQHHELGAVDTNEANWFSGPNPEYTAVQLIDPGRDGVLGTSDDQPITAYSLSSASNAVTTLTENDDRLDIHTKSVSFDLTKRFSHGWQLVGGYTYTDVFQQAASVSTPDALINSAGVAGGRAHDFKLAGSFQLPYQILFGVNARLDSGLPITRTWAIPTCTPSVPTDCLAVSPSGGSTTSINAEPRGDLLLPWLGTADIRFGRFFNVGTNRFDLSFDIYNITNANTVFSVRTTTGTVTVFQNNVPTNPSQTIAQFLSPTGVTAPRILRVNLTWTFGAR
jgi:Carboxypeptidase regulatory-like domain/TonB-dependent Receptor Plug Domain